MLQVVAPGADLPASHPARGKTQVSGAATAYVCVGPVCSLPYTDPEFLARWPRPCLTRRPPTAPPANAVARLTVPSPVGALTLFEHAGAITDVLWAASDRLRNGRPTPLLAEARDQLAAYFAGRLRQFDLPLAPQGTPFRQQGLGGDARDSRSAPPPATAISRSAPTVRRAQSAAPAAPTRSRS